MSFGLPAWQVQLQRHGRLAQVALAVAIPAVFAYGFFRGLRGWFPLLVALAIAAVALGGWIRWRRERFIREAPMPQCLKRKLRDTYPQLSQKDAALVERGLRQFFLALGHFLHHTPSEVLGGDAKHNGGGGGD